MSTPSQIRANRANAQKSTGPTTPEGKAASSANRLKHGIYSTAILLPHEDPAAYDALVTEFFTDLAPVGVLERTLVQRLADCQWRMNRLDAIEAGLYADYDERYGDREDRPEIGAFKQNTSNGYLPEITRQFARQERIFRRAMLDLVALQAQRKSVQSPKLASIPQKPAAIPAPPLQVPADPPVAATATPAEDSKAA